MFRTIINFLVQPQKYEHWRKVHELDTRFIVEKSYFVNNYENDAFFCLKLVTLSLYTEFNKTPRLICTTGMLISRFSKCSLLVLVTIEVQL